MFNDSKRNILIICLLLWKTVCRYRSIMGGSVVLQQQSVFHWTESSASAVSDSYAHFHQEALVF